MKSRAHKHSSDSITQSFCKKSTSDDVLICSEEDTLKCSNGANGYKNKQPEEIETEDEGAKTSRDNVVNVFQLMMDNRHKVIGKNSPGKEAVDSKEEDVEQKKKKLAIRKELLHKWAASKGTNKRKSEELERDLFISNALDKRAKRMKKLLIQNNKKTDNIRTEIDSDFEDDKSISDKKCASKSKKLGRKVRGKFSVLGKAKENCIEDTEDAVSSNKNLENDGKSTKNKKSSKSNCKSQKNWIMKVKLNVEETNNSSLGEAECITMSSSSESEHEEQEKCKKDFLKLAPLFIKTSKRKEDRAALKARREFLNSGLPQSLIKKKTLESQKRNLEEDYVTFPPISHIRLKPLEEDIRNYPINFWNLPEIKLPLIENNCDNIFNINFKELGSLTKLKYPPKELFSNLSFNKVTRFKRIVEDMKNSNPDYPVYKAFKILKQKSLSSMKLTSEADTSKKSKKRGRKRKKEAELRHQTAPDPLTWADKYRPSCFNEIFGNISSVTELKKWLSQWVQFKKEINANKTSRKRNNSTSSSEFDMTDGNSIDRSLPGNGMILVGPHGSGKTASLYAICNELDINVLELNASSKRTGKRLLQEIQEATQSHQVRKHHNSINFFFQPNQPSSSDENNIFKSNMCLLLVEDVDLVFDQDEGFLGALSQILAVSKRPVVMTTADPTCLHLQKFTTEHQVVAFAPMSSKSLGGWLQMVCLVEGRFVKKESLCDLLEFNKGDARKTLLQLEYWVTSGGNVEGNFETTNNEIYVDEGSNDSYFKFEEGGDKDVVEIHANCTDYFAPETGGDELWWNLYKILESSKNGVKSAQRFFDTISLSSVAQRRAGIINNKELGLRFWETCLKDSLSLNDCLDNYKLQTDFSRDFTETVSKISLLINVENIKINSAVPSTDKLRWRIKRHASDAALVQIVPLCSQLDRKSVAMDYLPTLRNVAKTEAFRFTTNSKRGNRFYHYLRGLGLDVNDGCFKTACETFKLVKNDFSK